MENAFDTLRVAIEQAKMVNRAVDSQVNTLVDLLEGRLRSVSGYRLARLKKELARFNACTKTWKA